LGVAGSCTLSYAAGTDCAIAEARTHAIAARIPNGGKVDGEFAAAAAELGNNGQRPVRRAGVSEDPDSDIIMPQ